ncbi:hypothetical protein DMJ13_27590 [halophilic archaeon]|nr:hypothetical protein DMJ13_27590 [halophilic archaeon]
MFVWSATRATIAVVSESFAASCPRSVAVFDLGLRSQGESYYLTVSVDVAKALVGQAWGRHADTMTVKSGCERGRCSLPARDAYRSGNKWIGFAFPAFREHIIIRIAKRESVLTVFDR